MSSAPPPPTDAKVTTQTFRDKKARAEPITMLTAYDYSMAHAIDQAGIEFDPRGRFRWAWSCSVMRQPCR